MSRRIVLADFFSGCGGTSRGFADAGIVPELAIDWDPDAVASFRLNFPATAILERDIRDLEVDEVEAALRLPGDPIRLFAGCAPCQPFADTATSRPIGTAARSYCSTSSGSWRL